MHRYFKKIGNSVDISAGNSKRLSDEIIALPDISDNSLCPLLNYIDIRARIKFDGQCIK